MKPAHLKKRRWLIITVDVEFQNGYNKIDFKIPSGIAAIHGVCFTTTTTGSRGEVSLCFSDTGFQPLLRQIVPSQANPKRKIKLLAVYIPVLNGCMVEGYYKDRSQSFGSYKTTIYLDCETHE